MILARDNGSKEFGDAEQTGICDIGRIDPVNDESFQFEEGNSQYDEQNSFPTLKLRGGAGSAKDRKSVRLEDSARVPAAVWFLAGKVGPPPTGKQLRKRRAKEEAYVERRQEEAEARREERKAKNDLKKEGEGKGKGKGADGGGLWKSVFGKKKKPTEKTRGDEESKVDDEKEVADGD